MARINFPNLLDVPQFKEESCVKNLFELKRNMGYQFLELVFDIKG